MIEIGPMDEALILVSCLHGGPIDPSAPYGDWQEAPGLPPHPWSDEAIADIARNHGNISEGSPGDPAREFMREMIQRYGTCAILAWERGRVVGFLRFYPLPIAQLLLSAAPERYGAVRFAGAGRFDPDPDTLWVQCVMTARPYMGREAARTSRHDFPSMHDAGARSGVGQKLARGLIDWATGRRWTRVVKQAHPDLDCFYGQFGGAGLAFWEKAGFHVIGTYREEPWGGEWTEIIERQRTEKGMTEDEVWTWFLMAYDL